MAINSLTNLKNYCFRELGSPVINIEVDSSQAVDRINEAVQFFVERHYDGTEEVYYHKTVTHTDIENGYLTMPAEYSAMIDVLLTGNNGTGVDNLDNYQYQFMSNMTAMMLQSGNVGTVADYYIQMSHLSLIQDMLGAEHNFDYNSTTNILRAKWNLNSVGSANLFKKSDVLSDSAWTLNNAGITANQDDPYGKQKAFSLYALTPGAFSISQTIPTKQYVRGMYTLSVPLAKGTYNGTVTMTISDGQGVAYGTSSITPGTLWKTEYLEATFPITASNDYVVKIEGTAIGAEHFQIFQPMLYLNKTIVLHGYKNISPSSSSIYDNRWLKHYATALIKRQWGTNLKKMSGVQMPGGIELNGQSIYDEAQNEIDKLMEQFAMEYQTLPTGGWF